jgi:pimeloyl-ACP methyl ester carboxylesterase
MAAVSLPQKSTTVRKNWKLSLLRSSFAVGGWLMPGATLQRAFRLFGTPMPGGRFKARAADTGQAVVETLAFGHEQIHCYRWGDVDRQPLAVLGHGWSGHGLQLSAWVAPLRRAGYAVVAFDQVAHGRSSGYRATLPLFADVLARVVQHYGGAAVLVAHSLGGAAAMIALARGMACEQAVLIAPAGDPLDAARRFGGFVGLAGHLSARLFEEFESLTGIDVEEFQVHRSASRLSARALIVHDLEDREVPWAEGERYARYWPAARLLSTQGLGHNRLLADPAVLAQGMAFLAGGQVGERVVSSPNLPFGIA